MNIRLLIAYDGTRFLGWQENNSGPSVESCLKNTLAQILQEPISLQAASRTDAGVHAEGQVVNFHIDKIVDLPKLHKSLNALLPKDLVVKSVEEASPSFHPSLDSTGKEYHYHICFGPYQNPFYRHLSWHFPRSIDVTALQEASHLLIGTRDFSAFCNNRQEYDKDPTRTLFSITVEPLEDFRLKIILRGNRFLYKMARNLSGTLAYIGCGKMTLQDLIQSKQRTQTGMTAPAHGLCLYKVSYD